MQYSSLAKWPNGHVKNPGCENLKASNLAPKAWSGRKVSRRIRVFQPKILPVTITEPKFVYVLLSVLVAKSSTVVRCPLHPHSLVYITVIRCICAARSASGWNILLNWGSSCRGLVFGLEYRPSASLITSFTLRVSVLT
jgi:hypothetical protein